MLTITDMVMIRNSDIIFYIFKAAGTCTSVYYAQKRIPELLIHF